MREWGIAPRVLNIHGWVFRRPSFMRQSRTRLRVTRQSPWHTMKQSARGSLLGIEHLGAPEILGLLKLARRMNPLKPRPLLRGKRVLLLFYEASTRTRSSFEIAAKSLGAMTTLVLSSGSSIEKGQSLLDAYTILRHKKTLKGLQVAIVGDIYHSRVARSAIHLLSKFGARLTLCGPAEFLPETAFTLAPGLHIPRTVEDAVHGADVIMTLRVQKERLAGTKISLQDYISRYQMTMARLKLAKKDAMLMHPGPIIRGLELTWEVADCPQSAIVEEVRNGVPVRMAILAKVLGRSR